MKRRIILLLAAAVVIGGGFVGYAVFRAPRAASQPISAVPLSSSTTYPVGTPAGSSPTAAPGADTNLLLFQIDPTQSSVRFTLNEVLAGSPKTVIGQTNQVAGQIEVNLANPSASRIGEIKVDARTLATDNDFRNRAIKNQILNTDTYEFVTFKPTALAGLPASVKVGDTFSFQVTGDLTIRDVTKSVTFTAQVTAASESQLTGKASTTVLRSDFGLQIPNVPNVANVTNEVQLEIDFTATR